MAKQINSIIMRDDEGFRVHSMVDGILVIGRWVKSFIEAKADRERMRAAENETPQDKFRRIIEGSRR